MPRKKRKERGQQLNRILRLMRKLEHTPEGMTLDELCSDFKISRRTLYRDIRALEEAGFRLESEGDLGEEKRWMFTDGQKRSMSSTFSANELLSLYFCLNLMDPLRGTPLRAGVESLLDKIESTFSEKDKEYYSNVIFTHVARPSGSRDFRKHTSTLTAVSRACLDNKVIEISYRASDRDKMKTYLFHPYCIAYFNGELYAVGFSDLRKSERTLRIDRIRKVTETNRKFERPDDFDAADFIERGFSMYQEGPATDVKLEFDPVAARSVRERIFHPSQEVHEKKGGKIEMTMKVQGLSEVARLVMQHAPNARVIKPKELAKMVGRWATDVAKRHK